MKQTLNNIARGAIFPYAGHDWINIETMDGATLALRADILKEAPFDEDGSADWRESSARAYLNGEFLEELKAKANDGGKAIIESTIPLTADDGTFRVESTDSVFLLSCDQYRRNRDVIEPLGRWWWTITRWSASSSYHVRDVDTDGSLGYYLACYGCRGLRPALFLSSDLLISDDDIVTPEEAGEIMQDMAERFGLGGVTSEDLAAGVSFLLGMLRGGDDLGKGAQ